MKTREPSELIKRLLLTTLVLLAIFGLFFGGQEILSAWYWSPIYKGESPELISGIQNTDVWIQGEQGQLLRVEWASGQEKFQLPSPESPFQQLCYQEDYWAIDHNNGLYRLDQTTDSWEIVELNGEPWGCISTENEVIIAMKTGLPVVAREQEVFQAEDNGVPHLPFLLEDGSVVLISYDGLLQEFDPVSLKTAIIATLEMQREAYTLTRQTRLRLGNDVVYLSYQSVEGGEVRAYSILTGKLISRLEVSQAHFIHDFRYLPDGSVIMITSNSIVQVDSDGTYRTLQFVPGGLGSILNAYILRDLRVAVIQSENGIWRLDLEKFIKSD